MRRSLAPALLLLAACAVADDQPTGPTYTVALSVSNAGTHLVGAEEVPARATRAQGQATFQLSQDGQTLHYKLNVANIENVVASHIHIGAFGTNGPVAVWLYGPEPAGGGRINGRIADGAISASDFTGPLTGAPMTTLLAHIRNGNAYVNVHTNDGAGAVNTGPGDFQSGEVRGQIDPRSL